MIRDFGHFGILHICICMPIMITLDNRDWFKGEGQISHDQDASRTSPTRR
jgi:hypothetical protein